MKFLVFWKNGEHTEIEGETIKQALAINGYDLSKVKDIAMYVEDGKIEDYEYHDVIELWLRKKRPDNGGL